MTTTNGRNPDSASDSEPDDVVGGGDGHRGYRAARALTPAELHVVFAAVTRADNPAELLAAAVRGVLDPLLADAGTTLDTLPEGTRIDPGDYAIPATQWQAIAQAVTDRAAAWGAGPTLALELVNLMPSTYPDPTVAAPPVGHIDHRPATHQMEVTREATDVIAACEAHLRALGDFFGWRSQPYLAALTSWHHELARLFSMALGAHSRIVKDGERSLLVFTGCGIVFGVTFHGARRRAGGC
jgi:hypothetical protein